MIGVEYVMLKTSLIKNVLYAIDSNMIFPERCEYRLINETLGYYIKCDYPVEKAVLFLRGLYKTWMYKVKVKYENLGKGFINIYVRRTDMFFDQCFCIRFRVDIDLWGYSSVIDSLRYGVIGSEEI